MSAIVNPLAAIALIRAWSDVDTSLVGRGVARARILSMSAYRRIAANLLFEIAPAWTASHSLSVGSIVYRLAPTSIRAAASSCCFTFLSIDLSFLSSGSSEILYLTRLFASACALRSFGPFDSARASFDSKDSTSEAYLIAAALFIVKFGVPM